MGKIAWQKDLKRALEDQILERTRKMRPADSDELDGATIDSVLEAKGGPLTFPLLFHVFLTSMVSMAVMHGATINSRMDAEVGAEGTITATDFHLGDNPPARNW